MVDEVKPAPPPLPAPAPTPAPTPRAETPTEQPRTVGRRVWDKRRITIIIVLAACVQLLTQAVIHLINKIFDAYDRATTISFKTMVEESRRQHTETIAVQRENVAAMKELASKIEKNSEADAEMRTAFWAREGIPPPRPRKK